MMKYYLLFYVKKTKIMKVADEWTKTGNIILSGVTQTLTPSLQKWVYKLQ